MKGAELIEAIKSLNGEELNVVTKFGVHIVSVTLEKTDEYKPVLTLRVDTTKKPVRML